MTNTETGTWKLLSGDTAGNKKTMNQGKVSTEPTFCNLQHAVFTEKRFGCQSSKENGPG